MRVTLAIDPGSVHCGMATFHDLECVDAFERGPEACQAIVLNWLATNTIDSLVVEGFQLYADKAMSLVGTGIETIEVIGVLRYLHRLAVVDGRVVEWVEQAASIKKVAAGICRGKGIRSVAGAKKAGGHAKDAELHGYYYLLKGTT